LSTQYVRLAAAAIVTALLAAGPALATKVVGVPVQGHVTSVAGVDAITVDGTQYPVKSGSQAAQALPQLTPGQAVTIVLDGPPSAGAHVIAVHTTGR
jgi:hypothetical protein